MPLGLSTWLPRLWRLFALGLALYLLQRSIAPATNPLRELSLEEARAFFPGAAKIHLGAKQELLVEDEFGNPMGHFVTTSPDADQIIGYSGPSNVLVALDPHDRIVGTRILSSDDTPDHVDSLKNNGEFERSLKQWRPTSEPTPKLQGYAGSTLTAYAITESIQKRLSGHYASMRFPSPLTLKDVQAAGFPEAHGFELNTPRLGWNLVRSKQGTILGYVVRTSPAADEINGYAGPTECLIAMEADGIKLKNIIIHHSYDTPDYVDRVKLDETYLKSLTQWNAKEWPTLDFEKAKLEGVAGATFTSYAVAEGIKRRFADDLSHQVAVQEQQSALIKTFSLWFFLLGGLVMTFSPLHGAPRWRLTWQILLIIGLGLWLGQLLSLSLLAGWARHGLPWSQTTGLIGLATIAFLVPWTTRRQIYCHQVCPHGAAQEILNKISPWKFRFSQRWHNALRLIPGLTLAVAFLGTLLWPHLTLNAFEPFDAWSLKAWAIPAIIAIVGLVVSCFVPQAYCKYGCPTGALLNFVRTPSRYESWHTKDTWIALILLSGVAIVQLRPSDNINLITAQNPPQELPVSEMHGVGFGTSWTVKIRGEVREKDALHREIAAEVNRIEFTLSHWRKNSLTSEFNASNSTEPFKINEELARVLSFTQSLTQATHGTYDVTVAPLVSAWSYGPAGQHLPDPTQADLDKILPQVGWDKVKLDPVHLTLQKSHPKLSLDLGSVLQGYAEDHIEEILKQHGYHDYLIEVGGELLASGSAWPVGIEDPLNPRRMIAKIMLKDQSVSPSGLYREKRLAAGKPVSHIISPKTGWPVISSLEMCCAFDRHCFVATGWATACMTAGWDDAKIIAEREGWAVWLVNSKGEIWKSSKAPQ